VGKKCKIDKKFRIASFRAETGYRIQDTGYTACRMSKRDTLPAGCQKASPRKKSHLL